MVKLSGFSVDNHHEAVTKDVERFAQTVKVSESVTEPVLVYQCSEYCVTLKYVVVITVCGLFRGVVMVIANL